MVPVASKGQPEGAGAPVVILTPAMVQAGVDAYRECDRDFDSDERVVTEVFQAVLESACGRKIVVSLGPESSAQSQWWSL